MTMTLGTRVPGDLGPACAKCGTRKIWTGTARPGWDCRTCGAERTARHKAAKSAEKRAADKARANELRNARRALWSEEKRAAVNAGTALWRDQNRDRHRESARRWYAENTDRALARRAARYQADPAKDIAHSLLRKARLRDAVCEHGLGCVDAAFLAEIYAAPCRYCGAPTEDADHFVPISKGGLHCRENIVPACGPCNGSKFNHDPAEWLQGREAS